MEIKEITNKETWESFFVDLEEKTFLQSWNWGEFQVLQNNKIWRFGIYNENKLCGAALIIKISAKRGTFLFIPHGPVIKGNEPHTKYGMLSILLRDLKELAIKEGASFIRISPFWERTKEADNLFKKLNFRYAPIHMHAEVTWELDVRASEEELLAGMRKTTRYLIKQAQKNPDIQIEKVENINDLESFLPIYIDTAKRHHFTIYSRNYLRDQFNAFVADKQIMLFFGKYKEEIVSAAIFVFWGGGAFYHHSGSLLKYSKIPMNYLLQWEAIKEAKKRGCRIYNFWGIAPDIKTEEDARNSKHPWAGLSLFKLGFGGFRRELLKTQDLIISNKYWINYLIELSRKLNRGL